MSESNTIATKEEWKEETYLCSAVPFELGQTVMTQGISTLLRDNIGASFHVYFNRHKNGDWGTMPIEDKILNDIATREGDRVMSSYQFCGEKIWIITEWDRSVTTALLPNEY